MRFLQDESGGDFTVNYCALACGVAPMPPGAQGSVRALLMTWRPKITHLLPLAPICQEGRQQVESRSSCLPWSSSHRPNLCL